MTKDHTGHRAYALWAGAVLLILGAGCASSEKSSRTVGDDDPFNTITADVINDSPNSSIHELLQGRIAGVDVFEQAGGIAIRIRGVSSIYGSSEPLYILDGFPTTPGPGNVFNINPHDIASIRVEKGYEAATYGVRGANGVIIISTKRGQKSQKD